MLYQKHVLLTFFINFCVYCVYGETVHSKDGRRNANLYENSACNLNGTQNGTCQYLRNCPAAAQGLRQGVLPQNCGYDGTEPIVCCVPKNVGLHKKSGISERMCKKWERQYCEDESYFDGVPHFIKGAGRQMAIASRPKEFPYMAAIGYGNLSRINWLCGGSLISERYVLTAAHCTTSKNYGTAQWVRLGDLNMKSDDEDARPENFKIIQHINHPDFKQSHPTNDIALYKLDRAVVFNEYIRPICLHTSYEIPRGFGTATGWGRPGYVRPSNEILLSVRLSFIPLSICKNLVRSSEQLRDEVNDVGMICAGEEYAVKNTCQGDSGGPLVIPGERCLRSLVGIISLGAMCGVADFPGLYTRVAHFVPWIEYILWGSL